MQANMENPISPFEKIEQYLEGNMPAEDKPDFENSLSREPAWKDEYQAYKVLTEGIRATGRRQLLLNLKTADATLPAFQPEMAAVAKAVSWGSHWKREVFYWAAAAAVLALLVPGYYYLQNQKTEKLFSQYFSPYQAASTLMTPSAEVIREYRKGDYATALSLLMNSENARQYNDTLALSALFYKGNIFLATQKPKEAIASFEEILQNPSGKYRKESEWYLALSYLKDNQPGKAKTLLKTVIADPDNTHRQEARDILKKL